MKVGKSVRIAILVALLSGLATFIYVLGPFSHSLAERQFFKLVHQGQSDTEKGLVDLRKLDAVEWDELVHWGPYDDICNFGISGYEKGSQFCRSSVDDSESYLLLLKSNRLVAEIRIDRRQFDLVSADPKTRIPKEKAVFKFVQSAGVRDPKQKDIIPQVELTLVPE